MSVLSCALIADGPTDRSLIPILSWAIRGVSPALALAPPTFVVRGSQSVDETIATVVHSYGPDVVFVHRDAEREPWGVRRREVPSQRGIVPVIPVRMTEAWLLCDEAAIRIAAGNPNGRMALRLPAQSRIESLPDPKAVLRQLLSEASGLHGRRLQRFNRAQAAHRVAELIDDFTPLRGLPAFAAFERELHAALSSIEALNLS